MRIEEANLKCDKEYVRNGTNITNCEVECDKRKEGATLIRVSQLPDTVDESDSGSKRECPSKSMGSKDSYVEKESPGQGQGQVEGQISIHVDSNIDRGWSDLDPALGPPPDFVCAVALVSFV